MIYSELLMVSRGTWVCNQVGAGLERLLITCYGHSHRRLMQTIVIAVVLPRQVRFPPLCSSFSSGGLVV